MYKLHETGAQLPYRNIVEYKLYIAMQILYSVYKICDYFNKLICTID